MITSPIKVSTDERFLIISERKEDLTRKLVSQSTHRSEPTTVVTTVKNRTGTLSGVSLEMNFAPTEAPLGDTVNDEKINFIRQVP